MPEFGLADVFRAITQVRRQTPQLAWMLDIPGVGDLLIRRAAGRIDDQTFAYRLYQTQWWRTTSTSQQQWSLLNSLQPADARAQRLQMARHVNQLIGTLGVTLPTDRDQFFAHGQNVPQRIADLALNFGWNDDQLTHYLLSFASFGQEGQAPVGGLGVAMTGITQLAQQYGVSPNDHRRFQWARDVVDGNETLDGIEQRLRLRALARYAGNDQIMDVLNSGGTVADFFDPYRQMISQEMEIPEAQVTIDDPRWSQVLSQRDAQGRVGPMSMADALHFVRSRPAWASTRGGQQAEAGMTQMLLQTFGRAA